MEAESRPPLPIFPFFLCFQTGLACLLALSPPKPSKIAGCSALTSFVALTYLCSTGDAARDYGVGNLIMIQAVTAYLLLWLVNPLCDYRHESDYTDPAKYPFLRRFWWMLSIINNPRGVGWSYEVNDTTRQGIRNVDSYVHDRSHIFLQDPVVPDGPSSPTRRLVPSDGTSSLT